MPDLKKILSRSGQLTLTLYASVAAFTAYFCTYAYRKPFTAGTFEGLFFFHMEYKTWLILAQVLGYMLSKFIGIRVIAEMKKSQRAFYLFFLIGSAELALGGFALLPAPYNILFMFLNGIPLGMMWGLVFSYLEGRRVTEILGAVLSASFILSSGVVKSAGAYLLINLKVSEYWMPFMVGLIFSPLLAFSVYMLTQLPSPNKRDEQLRTHREPMDKSARQMFFSRFAPGLVLLVLAYMLFTAFRDFRDNFAAEIWQSIGYDFQPILFTKTEIPVALVILALLGTSMTIKNNFNALVFNLGVILTGVLIFGLSTFLFQSGRIGPVVWMTMIGTGLYMSYVPFGCILFDRMLAAYHYKGNAGFMIYVADSFGYLGSVGFMIWKNIGQPQTTWLEYLINSSYLITFAGTLLILFTYLYFRREFLIMKENAVRQALNEPLVNWN